MALSKDQIKRRLGHGGQAQIARDLGFPDSLVSAVVNKKHQLYSKQKVQAVREKVAERLGESVELVWGNAA